MAEENDPQFVQHVMGMTDELQKHLVAFQKLSQEAMPAASETTVGLMAVTMEDESQCRDLAARALELAAEFANKGMDLGFQFASRGMELGYEFASKGEEVGPMANRILFMATQIGVMADRIGEMADRILFMANQIGEFGDRIVYVSQLIVYTEQLIVNVSVLANEAVRILSDLIMGLVALVSHNDAYFAQRVEYAKATSALPHVYENMNLMLRNMHEYSLKVLDNQAQNRRDELRVRELQNQLRETTQSANTCFCPCFCVGAMGGRNGVPPGES